MNTPPTLDRFESALLAELRAHVETHPVATAPIPAPRRHRRRWAVGLASAAAAATAFVVLSPGGPAVSPAYAVNVQADGDVVVTVHELEDAEGLEAALQQHGIDADVSFEQEFGNMVRFGGPALDYENLPPRVPGIQPDCGAATNPATLSHTGADWVLVIPAGSPLQDRPVQLRADASGSLQIDYVSLNDPWTYCAVLS